MLNKDKRTFENGFTLIEMLATIVILSILGLVSLPRFFTITDFQKSLYTNQIINTLRYARKLAVASGSHILVNVTPTSITLQRRVEGTNCNSGTQLFDVRDPVNNSSGYVQQAPNSITLTYSNNWPLYFDGLGQAMNASNCTMIDNATLTVVGGKIVTIVGATGFIQ